MCVFKHLYCSAQLSMSSMEKRYRNEIIIIIIIIKSKLPSQSLSQPYDRLVLKVSASRAEEPGFDSRLRGISAETCWPDVRLRLSEVETLICNFYLSVAACKLVRAYPSLRYSVCCLDVSRRETVTYIWATRGVTVSMSAFLACHQCCCAGSSLAWGLKLRAVVCGIF